MKTFKTNMKMLIATMVLSLTSAITWAQDNAGGATTTQKDNGSTTTTTTSVWVQPWVWGVAAGVIILLLILAFRGRSKTTESRTTVVHDR